MTVKSELSTRQRNEVRLIARKSWTDSLTTEAAKDGATKRIDREFGTVFIRPARSLSNELIDYWDARGITEPTATYAVGEPGCEQWDEW
jgi:hypothetical protein